MIITEGKKPSPSQLEWSAYPAASLSHQSDETNRLLVDVGGNTTSAQLVPNEPPPSFSTYAAEFFLDGSENVVSHDHHLNTDGEALYRFLLSQSCVIPTLRVTFKGTHTETKLRWVNSRDTQGHTTTRSESYTETVTDFDFCIDIHPDHLRTLSANTDQDNARHTPVHWSVGDDEPAFRGRMVRELDIPYSETSSPLRAIGSSYRRKAARKDVGHYLDWVRKRQQRGYPPWTREEEEGVFVDGRDQSFDENLSLRSSKTLRQWADEYCASPKYLKEFVYQKVLCGWNFSHLEKSLRSLVLLSPYNGDLEITFTTYSSKICIRPSNRLSRMLSNKWLKFLSIILLIFPFIWLFKRFHRKGGGIWEVCGGAYPLKQWVPVDQEEIIPSDLQGVQQEETLPPYDPEETFGSNPSLRSRGSFGLDHATSPSNSHSQHRSTRYMQTASGIKKLIGIREGEWFRNWEDFIIRAVLGKYQSSEPLRTGALIPAHGLDGYNDRTGTLIPM